MMKLRIECKTKLKVVELNNEFSSMHNIVVIVDQMGCDYWKFFGNSLGLLKLFNINKLSCK